MPRRTWLPQLLCATSALLFSACSGGGGGGGGAPAVLAEVEPNDASALALALAFDRFGTGDVATPGDVDYWQIALAEGSVLCVELVATRLDQVSWDASANVPRLTLYGTDGTSKLVEHDFGGFTSGGWDWAAHDLDLPVFLVPATGTYFVAVTQDDQALAGGAYAVRVSRLALGSIQAEAEPAATAGVNDTFATAEPIDPGTLHGFHVDGESDFYAFAITQPTHLRFELTAYRNGVFAGDDEYYDPVLTLYDQDGTTVLQSVDDAFFSDPGIQYRLTVPGTYFVEVTECCGAGDGGYFLGFARDPGSASSESEPNDGEPTADVLGFGSRIRGSTGPADTDVFRFTGHAGDMIRLQVFDEGNNQGSVGEIEVDFLGTSGYRYSHGPYQINTTILRQSGTIFVHVNSLVVTDYALELVRFQSSEYEVEPNGVIADANPLDGQERGSGVIDTPDDLDLFRLSATAERLTRVVIYAGGLTGSNGFFNYSGHGSGLVPLVTILDPTGVVIASSSALSANHVYTEGVIDGLPSAQVAFVAPATGTYFVQVEAADGDWFPNDYYVVEVK